MSEASTDENGPPGETDIGDVAEVPESERLQEDPPDDNGLGDDGAEDVSDVPVGEVQWLDGRDGP